MDLAAHYTRLCRPGAKSHRCTKYLRSACHFYFVFTKPSHRKVRFLFTDFETYKIVNKTQLQNISLSDITNAIYTNHTTTDLADTSEEHIFSNTENVVGYFLRLSCKDY